jgi:general secretion pathway protein G
MKNRKSAIVNRKSKGGFTLIEIMLVIVIIGIIVGIAVPKITGKVGKANDVAARASLKAIEAAVQSYEMDNLRLPDSLTDLTVQKNNNGPYLKPSELTDPWGQPFIFAKPGSHGIGFDLSCKSPEGKEFNNWE